RGQRFERPEVQRQRVADPSADREAPVGGGCRDVVVHEDVVQAGRRDVIAKGLEGQAMVARREPELIVGNPLGWVRDAAWPAEVAELHAHILMQVRCACPTSPTRRQKRFRFVRCTDTRTHQRSAWATGHGLRTASPDSKENPWTSRISTGVKSCGWGRGPGRHCSPEPWWASTRTRPAPRWRPTGRGRGTPSRSGRTTALLPSWIAWRSRWWSTISTTRSSRAAPSARSAWPAAASPSA